MAATAPPANRLREIRAVLAISQRQLAIRSGLTSRAIRQVESGAVHPKLETARAIANALGTTMDHIFPPEASDGGR